MNVVGLDINVIEQLRVHEAMVALQRRWFDRIIFIQVEGDDILEAEFFLLV